MKPSAPVRQPATSNSVPWEATFNELQQYVGKLVQAKVKEPHLRFGVFARLSRDFDGLIPRRTLNADYQTAFPPHKAISVVIEKVDRNPANNRPRIILSLQS